MKIEVKYNIDFGKALKILKEQNLDKYINADLADKTAKLARDYITDGKVKPKLSDNNPRGKKARPLFDTGKLAYSLKGTSQGIKGVDYAKEHREPGGYAWFKKHGTNNQGDGIGGYINVPQREFITAALSSEKSANNKIYKEFEKKFTNLLSKRIRKR